MLTEDNPRTLTVLHRELTVFALATELNYNELRAQASKYDVDDLIDNLYTYLALLRSFNTDRFWKPC